VKVNRKARRGALRGALSVHAERESVALFDAGTWEEPSTKRAASLLADWEAALPTLVLLSSEEEAAGKSFRNMPRVEAMAVEDAGVVDLVWAASVLVSQAALPALVARASARTRDGQEIG
jgi:large subunit ribosomal protein L4